MLLTRGSRGLPERSLPDWGRGWQGPRGLLGAHGWALLPACDSQHFPGLLYLVCKNMPFPGAGRLSIIDETREIALEKARGQQLQGRPPGWRPSV